MFVFKRVGKCLINWNFIVKNVRLLCFYDRNLDYLRNKAEYKNLVVQLDKDLSKYNIPSSLGLSSVLKEQDGLSDGFFYHLMQRENVMKLSSSQVKDILSLMANADIDTTKYALALKFLDEKCALSAERWPLDLSFYILDAWFIIWGPKIFRKHYYSAITSQWNRKIRKCSKFNLILVLYFIGLSKTAQPFLMEAVIDRMESVISEFSDVEMALACLSFFKCSKRVESTLFLERSCESAENLLKKHDHFNAISILKCLRLSKYYSATLWDAVQDYAIKESSSFNFVECTNFLAFFSTQNVYDRVLFEALEMQALSVLQKELASNVGENIKTHPSIRSRVKDIARFAWAMTTVGHPVKETTLMCLSECVEKRLRLGEYESQLHVLIDSLQSFILANHYPHHILTASLTPSTFKRIYNSERDKPKYQLYFVEKSLAIEHPEIPVYSRNTTNPIPKHLGNEIEGRDGFKELKKFLDQHFPNCCKSCYIMPHIMIAGLLFTKPRPSYDTSGIYHKYISNGIISKQEQEMFQSNRDYFCIEILDPSVCASEGSQPSGLMQTKMRQLKKLNFKVIALSSTDIHDIIQRNFSQDSCNLDDTFFSKLI